MELGEWVPMIKEGEKRCRQRKRTRQTPCLSYNESRNVCSHVRTRFVVHATLTGLVKFKNNMTVVIILLNNNYITFREICSEDNRKYLNYFKHIFHKICYISMCFWVKAQPPARYEACPVPLSTHHTCPRTWARWQSYHTCNMSRKPKSEPPQL